ncbi:Ribose-phosphate pyrophosphokinase protein [Halorhabdus tiamatea SARL4B]|uniref:ribose-phosphate diphosphokinase n=1 Tax=Halorhabdus tiamatea SARL4B TaxID=1033806 RepID=F7PH10_9EURY|nr:ribose-phosphate diphosphokinase [Halorhabdus tiamatea]ERJ04844.1 Ribose-phosphate pyrophosphokinase protein [Halorhabdus tiamatea SARL4B]CCQ32852.1 ribose-phosphate pyrophosphokinase [Halorhabdus tiamatea SARL4B]
MITGTSTAQPIAMEVSNILGEPLVDLAYDGSVEAAEDVTVGADERVVIVGSTTSSQAHLELLELQERAVQRDPDDIVTVIGYMGYSRQDKLFNPGEAVSVRAIAKALSPSTDRVYSVNPHNVSVLDYFDVPAEPIDAAPQLAEPLPDDLSDPVFLGPDEDAVWLAESVQETYGEGVVDNFEKIRHSATEVEMRADDKDFTGRDVVLVDDMIATGGTMSEAVRLISKQDTDRVYVSCVHPLLVDNALSKLSRAGVKSLYATDTIDRSISRVSAAPPIADVL